MTNSPPILADRQEDAARTALVRHVTWVGLLTNLGLSALKFVCGIVGSSHAVVADAVHSLSDTASDVAILVGVRYWSAPPDADHPHGHRRIETIVAVSIGVLLVSVAVGLVYNALARLHTPDADGSPGLVALVAALVSLVSKEVLYRWTAAAGRRARSTALMANAWHHRSDALSSIPAAVAVGAAIFSPTWAFLDHVGAVVVSFFILQAAWRIVKPALGELVDSGAPRADLRRIEAIANRDPEVLLVHALRTRYIGSGLAVDLHIQVDPAMSVHDGHTVSERVKGCLLNEGPDVLDVVVHLEPYENARGR